jgi:hypothetical protein
MIDQTTSFSHIGKSSMTCSFPVYLVIQPRDFDTTDFRRSALIGGSLRHGTTRGREGLDQKDAVEFVESRSFFEG